MSVRTAVVALSLLAAGVALVVLWRPSAPARSDVRGQPQSRPERRAPQEPLRYELDDPDIEIPEDSALKAPYFDLSNLDFEALRARSPDNLYWELAVPADDEDVLRARAAEKKRRNEQYGRVLASTATVAEIEDYYAYRQKLSEDYIEVSQLILDAHGDSLSDRDVGLLELSISLHTSRLAEYPKSLDDALRRKSEYDQVKQAWQEQQRNEANDSAESRD